MDLVIKRPGLVIGGVILIALLVLGIYAAAKIAFPIYMMMHRGDMDLRLAQNAKRQQDQLDAQNLAAENASMHPTPVPAMLPPVNPVDRRTEDDWLAAGVASEIVSMSEAIRHPDQPLPHLDVEAKVDPATSSVHVEINGATDGELVVDLKPSFVWDADGYAPLAQKALAGRAADKAGDTADVLADLQDLTGYNLAQADVRISADLQQHPASPQDHEAAAFVLCALALRENAAALGDSRKMLCRATAHLAIAQILRGSQSATWPGLVADAAIGTLAGRELDALSHLAALAARPDIPASAAPWLTALRTEAKQDWRIAHVTPASPLVLRIAWFQVLANDLDSGPAVQRLDRIVPPPTQDANGNLNTNIGNGDWQLPDWGRAVLAAPAHLTVENGNRFTEPQIPLELQELNQVFNAEGAPPVDGKNLAATLKERENDSVSTGTDGKPAWHALGLGTFKDATRRHLFIIAASGYEHLDHMIGSYDAAEAFRARMETLLRGVPGAEQELAQLGGGISDAQARTGNQSIEPWEIPAALGDTVPGYVRAKEFYSNGVPFGTTYQARFRLVKLGTDDQLVSREMKTLAQVDKIEEQIKNLPLPEQMTKFHELTQPINKQLETDEKNRGLSPREKALLKLAPDNYDLATDHLKGKALLAAATPFFDYNTRAFGWLELDPVLEKADSEAILRRDAAFNPAKYFTLAALLRKKGNLDEAAAMDRLGVAQADDEVTLANSVGDLVGYDLDHGNKQEAEQIAKRAAATGAAGGMCTEMYLFDRENQLDAAEAMGQQLQQSYGNTGPLMCFYARHRDRYPTQYAAVVTRYFPDGMDRATFDTFYQPPEDGIRISGEDAPTPSSGLKLGDVIVACDGYRVKNVEQYDIAREQLPSPENDFIVWSGGKYEELKPSLPDHLFQASVESYTATPK